MDKKDLETIKKLVDRNLEIENGNIDRIDDDKWNMFDIIDGLNEVIDYVNAQNNGTPNAPKE